MATVFKRGGKASRDGRYYYAFFDENGKRQVRSARTTDKATAERIAAKHEADAALRRDGVIDPGEDRFAREGRRPIEQHLADFRTAIYSRGNTERHCYETYTQASKVIASCKVRYTTEISPSAVQKVVKDINDSGRSLRCCNHYLKATKAFSKWLYRDKRIRHDVLESLKSYNAATDVRRSRRALTDEEICRLVDRTERRTFVDHGLSGPDRAMLYRLAIGTGLRASELRSLKPSSFHLDGESPSVVVAAAHSKRRREDNQLIADELAVILRPWLEGRPPHERIFAKMPKCAARMMVGDLNAARLEWIEEAKTEVERQRRDESDFLRYVDSTGKVIDFHSLRHTYITRIVNGGASVKVAQDLARHSSPTLTFGYYSHTRLHDLKGAINSLPSLAHSQLDNRGVMPHTGAVG